MTPTPTLAEKYPPSPPCACDSCRAFSLVVRWSKMTGFWERMVRDVK